MTISLAIIAAQWVAAIILVLSAIWVMRVYGWHLSKQVMVSALLVMMLPYSLPSPDFMDLLGNEPQRQITAMPAPAPPQPSEGLLKIPKKLEKIIDSISEMIALAKKQGYIKSEIKVWLPKEGSQPPGPIDPDKPVW